MMAPGMQCVLDLLRNEMGRRTISVSEWEQALHIAKEEHVVAFFVAKFRQCDVSVPSTILQQIEEVEHDAKLGSFWLVAEQRGILRAFAEMAIPVLPLKGPFLAERLYGDIRHRSSRDLDLLVNTEDGAAAYRLLEKLEFAEIPKSRNAYHSGWRRGRAYVELHHNVANPAGFKFDTDGAWERAAKTEFLGQPVRQFTPADELLYLCIHGTKHCFNRLNLVLDLVMAFRHLSPRLPPEAFMTGPNAGLHHLIVLGYAIAKRLDPQLGPAPETRINTAIKVRMEKLAEESWQALMEGKARNLHVWNVASYYIQSEPVLVRRLQYCAHLSVMAVKIKLGQIWSSQPHTA